MMWLYAGDVGNWAVARVLDSAVRGDDMPRWAPEAGLVLIGLAVVAMLWLAVRSVRQRRLERRMPARDLLDARPWLAIDPYTVEPAREMFYRGRRRARREHRAPAHPEVAVTQLLPRTSDAADATITIPTTYGGAP